MIIIPPFRATLVQPAPVVRLQSQPATPVVRTPVLTPPTVRMLP